MEHHQRLLCSSSSAYSPRQDWHQHPTYFPPSPPTTNHHQHYRNNNSWIRPSSSTLTKVTPNSDDNSNYYHSWLHTLQTPSSPVLNSTNRQRYTPRFASIKSHSPNYYPLMQANLQKDTTLTKIFVGGLPYHTTDETLRAFFSKFGDIEEAVVINDRSTGKSRGYGFVTMVRKEDAEEAVKDGNPTIDGRRANVNLAYMGAKNRATTVPLGYSLVARMPTYQSTATAYPSNLIYYPLAQQPTLQQPIYLTPTNGGTGTTWPSNLLSHVNLANLSTTSATNVGTTLNPGTSSPQTVYEVSPALLEAAGITSPSPTIAGTAQSAGQQLYWPGYT
ncbi:unnamed protein product [Adineta steineri]|uniref:RRM domain-containing protein n=1 Tax=Adineta steineri TaxID=433720 RepID=A0A819MNZ9_9BILA|nr:unnamed protein product [Adineta steineri]CAF1001267.1 unnamed protein product [Adineta steineri]CAF1049081.1 unnamed protein product [Adineta steineri]CAF3927446.1 unnamed protein product [Adineta steineri]CAF3984347.1 unnamed protein product [Adineta steineri]